MYQSQAQAFVLRQWPSPEAGWDSKFPGAVGFPNAHEGVYAVTDFLKASSYLRDRTADWKVPECALMEQVANLIERRVRLSL